MSLETISLTIGAKVPTAIYISHQSVAVPEPVCIVNSMGERTDDAKVARRLVACWNACLGMSIESLESMPGHYFGAVHEQRKLTAEQQRDELLAAIERISSYVDPLTGNDAKAMREMAKSARDKVLGD